MLFFEFKVDSNNRVASIVLYTTKYCACNVYTTTSFLYQQYTCKQYTLCSVYRVIFACWYVIHRTMYIVQRTPYYRIHAVYCVIHTASAQYADYITKYFLYYNVSL